MKLMTETEWLDATDPQPMLDFLRDKGMLSDRKLRLFFVACCRHVQHWLTDPRARTVLDFAEQLADAKATRAEVVAAWSSGLAASKDAWWEAWGSAIEVQPDGRGSYGASALYARLSASKCVCNAVLGALAGPRPRYGPNRRPCHLEAAFAAGREAQAKVRLIREGLDLEELEAGTQAEGVYQTAVLRDLVGNPFRALSFESSWCTADVVTLAGHIYHDRAFSCLPELADALGDAGCADAKVLGHLRSPGPHVRGCFAVDAVLGKT